MWFKNLQLYRLPQKWGMRSDELEARLAFFPLSPCAAKDSQSLGWVSPCRDGGLVHCVDRHWLLALGVEQKLLPASVVRQFAEERAKAIETQEGRAVGRKEMRQIRESMAIELLPRAFTRRRTCHAWIDPRNGWLAIDTANSATAEELLGHLRKSVGDLSVRLLKTSLSPSAAMTAWVAEGEVPGNFTIDQDLELRSAENSLIRYARHTLEGDEICQHIAAGKVVKRLAMTWNDRISFLFDEKGQVKRLSFLDLLKEESDVQAENEDERFDLDFALMSGELARLLDDLVKVLGGEIPSA